MAPDRVVLAPVALREWAATMRRRLGEVEAAVDDVHVASRSMVAAHATMPIDPVYVPPSILEVVRLVRILAEDTEHLAGDVVATDLFFHDTDGGLVDRDGRAFAGWAQLVARSGWQGVAARGDRLEADTSVEAGGSVRCATGLLDRYPAEGVSGPWSWPVEGHAWIAAANDVDRRYGDFRALRRGVALADAAETVDTVDEVARSASRSAPRSAAGARIADGVSDLSARFPQAAELARTGARTLGAVGLGLTVVDTASDVQQGDWGGVASNTASLAGSLLLVSTVTGPVGWLVGGMLVAGSLAWENRQSLAKLARWTTRSPRASSSRPTGPPTEPPCRAGRPPSRSSRHRRDRDEPRADQLDGSAAPARAGQGS